MRIRKENYNLIDAESGLLTVVADSGKVSDRNEHLWLCQCACGNPQLVSVRTKDILAKHKRSCGCLKRSNKNHADHLCRDCREAVSLALYWAPIWDCALYIHYGRQGRYMDKAPFYTVTSDRNPRCHVQLGYIISPKAEVRHCPGYPDYATLFGRTDERIYLQFRRKDTPSAWITYGDNFEVFWAHQRALAEQRVRELNEKNQTFEHRIKED